MKGIMPLLAFCLLATILGARSWQLNETQVLVQVYYESLSSQSINWISGQLGPTYSTLGPQWMAVQLIPFGRTTTFLAGGNSYAFRCDHGSAECDGNKLQACALARLSQDNKKQVNFVVCVMGQDDPSTLSDDCANKAGLDAVDLKACVDGEEGALLLASFDRVTPRAQLYAADELPVVLFNKETKMESDAYSILEDLVDFVCGKIKDMTGSTPDACNTPYPYPYY